MPIPPLAAPWILHGPADINGAGLCVARRETQPMMRRQASLAVQHGSHDVCAAFIRW
jgi:hypothetical protein